MPRLIILLLVLATGLPTGARAADHEAILDFKSDIAVHADASMTVTETITVRSARRKIKRGIYRDFPTAYQDRHGNRLRVAFDVIGVTRDGRAEAFHTEGIRNGRRLYIGNKDVILNRGVHTYRITYRTDRQIGYFENFDELYWNVTGNDWAFPIEHAEATITLPGGAAIVQRHAYTGKRGDQGKDFTLGNSLAGRTIVATTRTLAPGEGLTIAVAWPKGIVAEPSSGEKTALLLRDNFNLIVALIGLPLILAYYLYAWNKVGRDPEAGTIVPLFAPPENFSPGLTRALVKMGPDKKTFSAAVVSMAVKGYLRIDEDDGDYTLVRLDASAPNLSTGERALGAKLFGSAGTTIELNNKNHKRISKAKDAFENKLKAELESSHYTLNRTYLIPGAVLSILTVIGVVAATPGEHVEEAAFMSVWLTVWSAGCGMLLMRLFDTWKRALASRRGTLMVGAVLLSLFALPFLGGEVAGLVIMAQVTSPPAIVFLILIGLLFVAFWHLIKAPTLHGRRMLDRIEGFKLYLSVAEKERWATLHPPQETPALFERYLPYALALDVEHQWSERFAAVLAAADAGHGRAYRPTWYSSGHAWDSGGGAGIGDSLSAGFSSALAASASAPGSSGGGSSGGGGGGGGGGGW